MCFTGVFAVYRQKLLLIKYEILFNLFSFFPLPHIARTLAHNEFRLIFYVINAGGLCFRVHAVSRLNLPHNNVAGIPAFQRHKMLNGGKRRMGHSGIKNIIAPDYRHIPGNLIFLFLKGRPKIQNHCHNNR